MKDKKRPSKPTGPLRLAWPGGGGRRSSTIGRPATLVSTIQESRTRKRKRDTLLWVDKYAPTTAAQLCVAPKKVKEVRTWLLDTEKLSRLLVFVGSPGVGKSTVIQILGQELGWTVNEWSDSYTSRNYSRSGGGGGGSLASVDQSNSLESFQEFLDHAGAGFSPLELSMETTKMTNNSEGKSIILIDEVSMSMNSSMKHKRARADPSFHCII
jgi:cell cycle checkpoint protein